MPNVIKKYLNAQQYYISSNDYELKYNYSIENPENFWADEAKKNIDWIKPWKKVLEGNFADKNVKWFPKATLNVCANCIDRHLPERANKTAIIWEGDEVSESKRITYQELYNEVCKFANGLKSLGVKKGDRVCIYMPMLPEAAIAMLACSRIGAIHSVVFAGFSPNSLKNRINDSECSVIITADYNKRGGKHLPLKENVDEIINDCPSIRNTIVIKNSDNNINIKLNQNNTWYHELIVNQSYDCPYEELEATDPLFILYTSGSTGKPKGILHGTGGYILYTTMTFKYIFNYHENDIYWCTADIGWITGHSYIVYGPLSNGATTLMYAGVPNYPDYSRFWEIIDKHQVNIFYTAPTAIRTLMREGDSFVKKTKRTSLKLLGSVGEPINPEVWNWYYNVVGNKSCPIVDTWWQTETGGIMISPMPGATELKPGSAVKPFLGIEVGIVDDNGKLLDDKISGNLVITKPWPGQCQTIYGDHDRYITTYLSKYPGMYYTGDDALRDEDGFYWITGRVDDVINVSGHRLDTAEIEGILVSHPSIAEAAVVGMNHDIKGQAVYAFVTPKLGIDANDSLSNELINLVRKEISPIATPEYINFTNDLPKTRSGKIMRRILTKIVNKDFNNIGDISTLSNPDVVENIKNSILEKEGS